eukprot:GHVN01082412.1.p1 GENE.GHVN01082412.1~~GHVN01082412.1.p1  ORF type:complete len:514 (+),score=101.08 GHVN01082412.1:345-1886(+)
MSLVTPLFSRLSDVEVNSVKRVCVLTSRYRDTFMVDGVCKKTLLMLAEASQLTGEVQPIALEFMRARAQLSWLIHTYSKPLVSLVNGACGDSAGVLSFLANRSAAYTHSTFRVDSAAYGWIPDGGLSHSLGWMSGGVGAYLTLTGVPVQGPDLVWTGLCRHWVSPEAFKFLELTAENLLNVSEHDSNALLTEHFLHVPPSSLLLPWTPLIDAHFDVRLTLTEVLRSLQATWLNDSQPEEVKAWASDTLKRISRRSPLALAFCWELVRRSQLRMGDMIRGTGISPADWKQKYLAQMYSIPATSEEDHRLNTVEEILRLSLGAALGDETKCADYLFMQPETLEWLAASLAQSKYRSSHSPHSPHSAHSSHSPHMRNEDEMEDRFATRNMCLDETMWCQQWDSTLSAAESRVKTVFSSNQPSSPRLESYLTSISHLTWRKRIEIPVSSYPRVRALSPTYDPITGLDHDHTHLQGEVNRWKSLNKDYKQLEWMISSPQSELLKQRAVNAEKLLSKMS